MFLEISLSRNNKQKHVNWNYFNSLALDHSSQRISLQHQGLGRMSLILVGVLSHANYFSAKDWSASVPSCLLHRAFLFLSPSRPRTCTIVHNVCPVQLEAWKCENPEDKQDRVRIPTICTVSLGSQPEKCGFQPETQCSCLLPSSTTSPIISLGKGGNLICLTANFPYDLQHSCLIAGSLHLLRRQQRGSLTKTFTVKMVQCLWKYSLVVHQLVKHRVSTWPSHFIPRHIKRNENIHSYINLNMNVYIQVIHHRQKVDPSTDELM